MNRTFDRKAYRQELIDAGFSAEDAETIASRTVMRAPRETFQSVGSMVQQATAKIERDSVQLAPPALPAPSAAVERSRRLEQEAAGLAKSMTIDTRGTMTTKKRKTAGEDLAKQVSEAKQAALLKHTKQQIKEM